MELLRTSILTFWSFGCYFLFCEYGEMVTNQFVKFNDALDQCSWYLFSIEMQHNFVVIVLNAQQPTTIRGYGNSLCARESFKMVISFSVVKNATISINEHFMSIIFFHSYRQLRLAFRISQCYVKSINKPTSD